MCNVVCAISGKHVHREQVEWYNGKPAEAASPNQKRTCRLGSCRLVHSIRACLDHEFYKGGAGEGGLTKIVRAAKVPAGCVAYVPAGYLAVVTSVTDCCDYAIHVEFAKDAFNRICERTTSLIRRDLLEGFSTTVEVKVAANHRSRCCG